MGDASLTASPPPSLPPLPPTSKHPDRLVIVAGTYDGVLAGWDTVKHEANNNNTNNTNNTSSATKEKSLLDQLNSHAMDEEEHAYLKMNFAMAVHEGSVRSLAIASGLPTVTKQPNNKDNKDKTTPENNPEPLPATLVSAGYDESIAIFSLMRHVQQGEVKTPSKLGTPTATSFAPPHTPHPSHVLIGLNTGKILIYRKRDWTVQHILSGHDEKGVTCLAVHPSGKMALSGGRDGKICLWDLARGRLSFVQKLKAPRKGMKATVNHLIWSGDGLRYAYCTHGGSITARDMSTGKELLDIALPVSGRANQICFLGGEEGLFLAAACNDGSLPLFAVGGVDEEDEEEGMRRAMMAIEPVEGVASAGEERFKCIQSVEGSSGFLVVTANSGGIISLIDLEGAARMILSGDDDDNENVNDDEGRSSSDDENDDSVSDEEEVAAEILESVRIGSGARVTSIAVWSHHDPEVPSDAEDIEMTMPPSNPKEEDENGGESSEDDKQDVLQEETSPPDNKGEDSTTSRGRKRKVVKVAKNEIEMDEEALERARELVSQAKKRQKRKKKKESKKK